MDEATNRNRVRGLKATAAFFIAAVATFPVVASISITPFNPRPSDSVTISVDGGIACVSIDRVERTNESISVFVKYSSFGALTGCTGSSARRASAVLGVLPAASYTVELVSIDPARPTRDSVVSQAAFIVAPTNKPGNLPTRIEAIGSVALVQDPQDDPFAPSGRFAPLLFQAKDAQGLPVPGVPYEYAVIDSNTKKTEFCRHYSLDSDCGRSLSGTQGEIGISPLQGPWDSTGNTFFTWEVSTPVNPSVKSYVTVGYIDAKRRDQVVPVIEYEVQFRQPIQPISYFITSSEDDMKLLDKFPEQFRRTYDAFFGVTAGTAGAQPVCRFAKGLPATSRYFHWYTADASECAAKRNDPSYVYEGTPFWAYPANASGGCPKDTRGVNRYLYKQNGAVIAARYSLLNSMRTRAGGSVSTDYYTVQLDSDGVAFCVPD